MDMRRPPRIRHRLDRPKIILPRRRRQKPPIPLKILIPLPRLPVEPMRMNIRPLMIHLPNLNQRIPHRLPTRIEHAPAQMRHLSHRRRNRIIHNQQIIIRIQRQPIRIKWPLRQLRRPHPLPRRLQLLRKHPPLKQFRDRHPRRHCSNSPQKPPPTAEHLFHKSFYFRRKKCSRPEISCSIPLKTSHFASFIHAAWLVS